ncbi:MAG: cadmium-translocating P-type ATPase [Bryobacteraceae bacterium]|nr:cadmium-translocating P-type ATPase [Bryobacteraceae bacterium]
MLLLGALFAGLLAVLVAGEWFGWFELLTSRVPAVAGWILVPAAGYPVFRNVVRAAARKRITSHTLMTTGALAALIAGEWPTALIVVLFMRLGDAIERFTTRRARQAIRQLATLAPQKARIERDGVETEVRADCVEPGTVVIVRPGEAIPVDGEVIGGHAWVDQSAVTGESMPVEAGPGTKVFAASYAHSGMLRVRTERAGSGTVFGRVLQLVAEAEAHKGDVERTADRFSARYLPVVLAVAALTLLLRRDLMATIAVLVVACSCSFALATPVAMLAAIGAAARRGLLVKGGRYLELLARADVVLIDKTGTLTLGRPQITDVVPLNGASPAELLRLAASAERYSEHPLAEAVRGAAREQGLEIPEPERFEALPGVGVRAVVGQRLVSVGNRRLAGGCGEELAARLESEGKTVLFVCSDGRVAGLLGASDALRPDVAAALDRLRKMGRKHIELITGDHPRAALPVARSLNLPVRAGLLPQDKIAVVREYQSTGHTVVMIGDGVNDAPALAQADVGIAMGAAGSPVAVEAAHAAVLADDWSLVPGLFALARRTLRVVRGNLLFTGVYNLVGLSLAALGLLPPTLAAAAQSLPDVAILANSSRLLRTRLG